MSGDSESTNPNRSENEADPAAEAGPTTMDRRAMLTGALGAGLAAWTGVVARSVSRDQVRPALLRERATYHSEILACGTQSCVGLKPHCGMFGGTFGCSQNGGWECTQHIGGDCAEYVTACEHHTCNQNTCSYHTCDDLSCLGLHCHTDMCTTQSGDCSPFTGSCQANTTPTTGCETACQPNSPPGNCTAGHEVDAPPAGLAAVREGPTSTDPLDLQRFTRIGRFLAGKRLT